MKLQLQETLLSALGNSFNHRLKYIISITGVTTSGKSTASSFLKKILSENPLCKVEVLNMDNYYKEDQEMIQEEGERSTKLQNFVKYFSNQSGVDVPINYESPGAFRWDVIKNNILCFLGDSSVPFISSVYSHSLGEMMMVENESSISDANILIVEGLYAQTLFDDMAFDFPQYNPCDISEKAKNLKVFSDKDSRLVGDEKVLKIFMDIPDSKIREHRLVVDQKRTKRPAEKTQAMLDDFIIPASNNWVRLMKAQADYIFENGTYDSGCGDALNSLIRYFGINKSVREVKDLLKQEYASEMNN